MRTPPQQICSKKEIPGQAEETSGEDVAEIPPLQTHPSNRQQIHTGHVSETYKRTAEETYGGTDTTPNRSYRTQSPSPQNQTRRHPPMPLLSTLRRDSDTLLNPLPSPQTCKTPDAKRDRLRCGKPTKNTEHNQILTTLILLHQHNKETIPDLQQHPRAGDG